ncbi:MAG: hypothetical protein WBG18_25140, partial [Xanthobacteraceae bacterium]
MSSHDLFGKPVSTLPDHALVSSTAPLTRHAARQKRRVSSDLMPNTRKILIVDDDPELRDALTEQL